MSKLGSIKELSPEQKRMYEIQKELRELRWRHADLERELWALEGYPPIPVTVTYDDGENSITETFLHTKELEDSHMFYSPDIEGRFNLPKTVLKAKNV